MKLVEHENDKSYLIDGLYVDTSFRNRGIATKLISESIELIKKTNVKHIDINVLSNNKIAHKLYRTIGFNEFKISLRKDL